MLEDMFADAAFAKELMELLDLPQHTKRKMFDDQKARFERDHTESFIRITEQLKDKFEEEDDNGYIVAKETREKLVLIAAIYDENMTKLAEMCDVDINEVELKVPQIPQSPFSFQQLRKPADHLAATPTAEI